MKLNTPDYLPWGRKQPLLATLLSRAGKTVDRFVFQPYYTDIVCQVYV